MKNNYNDTALIIRLLDNLEDARDVQAAAYTGDDREPSCDGLPLVVHPDDAALDEASRNAADNAVILAIGELEEAGYQFPKYEPTTYTCDESAPF
jgi:hypothetical protein